MREAKMRVLGKWNDIHPDAEIGEGTTIWSWNRIGRAKIGRNCKISNWVHIEDGCVIGDNCNFQPYVILNGNTRVGDRVFFAGGVHTTDIKYPTIEAPSFKEPVKIECDAVLGNGCKLSAGITIGRGAVIGLGAVVTKSVPDNEVWIGVPARFYCTREEYDRKKRDHESKRRDKT